MHEGDEGSGTRVRSACRTTGALLLLLTLALAGPGCRSSPRDDERARGAPSPTEDAAAVFCGSARDFLGRLGAVVDPARPADVDPVGALYREMATFLDAAARTGPREIQADAATAASITKEYYEALQRAAFVPSGVPPETSAKLQSEQFEAGVGRVADYARAACGLAD